MADELICASATQALVLADARHEQALATYSGGGKRHAKWGGSVPKKGKRWGLSDDKPYKPLPYVDLPVGLSDQEVDQFLREQRLEDLSRKIQLQHLEDADPDIRPPSPPPLYDRAGNRLNTREIRVRKAMLAEYNRLIRYMVKSLEGYTPPPDWRPQRLIKKIIIPYEKYPNAPFMGVIIGARGVNHKRLQEVTGCRIFIRGKDIGDKFQSDEEQQMPQHVHIEGDTEEQIAAAEKLVQPLLNPESPEFEYARTNGMQQVAIVNGFTLAKKEQRCGLCGALGHLSFECPESGGQNYKMANVVCSICGDKGHVASDCKVAAEKHQRENVDWKADAERKASMNADYQRMMSELGMAGATEQEAQDFAEQALGGGPRPDAGVRRPPVHVPRQWQGPAASPLASAGAGAALALIKAPQEQRPMAPPGRVVPPTSGYQAAPKMPAWQRPKAPPTGTLQPLYPSPAPAVASQPRPAPWRKQEAPWRQQEVPAAPAAPWRQQTVPPPPLAAGLPDVDSSLACPPELAHKLRVEPHIIADMSCETGTRIAVSLPGQVSGGNVFLIQGSRDAQEKVSGGNVFLIQGSRDAQEKAKMHIRAWMDVSLHAMGLSPAPAPPWQMTSSGGSYGSMASAPGGFPPEGFPPSGFPPSGFPPAGFPPAMGFPPDMGPPAPGGGMPAGFPPGFGPPGQPPPGFPPGMDPGMGFPPGMPPGMGGGMPPGMPPGFPPGMPPGMDLGPMSPPDGAQLGIYDDEI